VQLAPLFLLEFSLLFSAYMYIVLILIKVLGATRRPIVWGTFNLCTFVFHIDLLFAEESNPIWMQNKKDLLLNRTTGGWGPRSCRRLKQKQQELEDELLAFEIYKQQVYQSAEESAMRTNYSGDLQHIY
jgi:hypothetical protein